MTQAHQTKSGESPKIKFKATLYELKGRTILRLPAAASAELPTRSQVMVEGVVNGAAFKTPLEPDGKLSHWFEMDAALLKAAHAAAGDTVEVELQPTKEWIEPDVPADLKQAIAADPKAQALWHEITPLARWEWIRWTRSTLNPDTRAHRIEVAISKMDSGERRPCCWNRNWCTDPTVSKSGVLLDPPAKSAA
jgi:hypothetical protein